MRSNQSRDARRRFAAIIDIGTVAVDSFHAKHNLLAISREIEDRVRAWRYPPADEEIKSEDDPEIVTRRKYRVFGRSVEETFGRHELEAILVWLEFSYPKISERVLAVAESVAKVLPTPDHARLDELEEIVVELAEAALLIGMIAEAIPGAETEADNSTTHKQTKDKRGGRKRADFETVNRESEIGDRGGMEQGTRQWDLQS